MSKSGGQSVLFSVFLRRSSLLRIFLAILVLFGMFSGVTVYARSSAFLYPQIPTDDFSREYLRALTLGKVFLSFEEN
ncbi:hypothetical protein [Bartonella taylorii]|uniref:hypothetical protein n=1 Tax=Bartonella taylorii TaxID=33046 RepID=UPI003B82D4C4